MKRSSSAFFFTGQAGRATFFFRGQLRLRRFCNLCLPIAAITRTHQRLCSAAPFGTPASPVCNTLSVPVNDISTGDIPFSLAACRITQRTTKCPSSNPSSSCIARSGSCARTCVTRPARPDLISRNTPSIDQPYCLRRENPVSTNDKSPGHRDQGSWVDRAQP